MELPEQIKYLIRQIKDKKLSVFQRQNYIINLADIHDQIEKVLKEYQLELYDYKNPRKRD